MIDINNEFMFKEIVKLYNNEKEELVSYKDCLDFVKLSKRVILERIVRKDVKIIKTYDNEYCAKKLYDYTNI